MAPAVTVTGSAAIGIMVILVPITCTKTIATAETSILASIRLTSMVVIGTTLK